MSDFNPVVWFTPKPCGTHFLLPHHLAYILQFLKTPLNFEPSGHRFPPNSTQNLYTHFIEGSPLSMSDFNPVVWFTPKPCGTHFLLPHHLAYILQFLKTPLNFEPSGHRFPSNSPQNLYTHFIEGSTLGMSDFNPVVWFTPKPCGTHFLLPHDLAYILQFLKTPLNFEPSGHRFPPNSPQNLYTHSIEGSPLACRTLTPSSGSPQNRVVLISFYHITWLTYCSF